MHLGRLVLPLTTTESWSEVIAPPQGGTRGTSLVLALSAASVAGGLFLPLSLVYFTVLTDIPLPQLGAIVTGAGVLAIPLPVLAGSLVDRVGARTLVLTALVLQSLAYLAFVVVRMPLPVFAASAVMAVAVRLFWSTVFSLVAEHAETDPTQPVEAWFARINVIRTVGIVFGGLTSGIVVSIGRVEAYLVLALIAASASAVGALLLIPRGGGWGRHTGVAVSGSDYLELLRDRGFLVLLATNSVFALSTLFAGLTIPTLVRSGLGGPGWLTSGLLVANALLVALLGRRGGRIAARRPALRVLWWAATLWGATFLVMAFGGALSLPWAGFVLLLAIAILSGAEVLHAPASSALVNELAGASGRGRYLAVFQYSFVAAELVGPVLFTSLFTVAPVLPFLAVAGVNVLTLPCLAVTQRLLHGRVR